LHDGKFQLVEPFFGGGSLGVSLIHYFGDLVEIYGSDIHQPLADFWSELIEHPEEVAGASGRIKSKGFDEDGFRRFQKEFDDVETRFGRAVRYFVLNRCSYGGLTLSGGLQKGFPRFTPKSIVKLRVLGHKLKDRLTFECCDYETALAKYHDMPAYLDPPYALEDDGGKDNLYGTQGDTHKGFDHERLADILHNRTDWILSYNDSPYIRDLYYNYEILQPEWNYGLNKSRKSNEVLILSDDGFLPKYLL